MKQELVERISDLINVLTAIEDKQDMFDFLDDLCTSQELEQMIGRLEAAKMLMKKEKYDDIIAKTKISSATLSRVSKCIQHGNGGYIKAIAKCEESNK